MRIRQDVKALNRRVEALLQQADPAVIRGDTLYLVSPYEFHRTKLNSDEARRIVEDVVSRHLDRRLQVSCISRDEADRLRASAPPPRRQPATDPARDQPAPVAQAPEPDPSPPEAEVDEGPPIGDDDAEVTLRAAMNIFDAEPVDD